MNIGITRKRRVLRIRKKLFGTEERPRLSIFRSNNHMYAQIINDAAKKTIVGVSEKTLSLGKEKQNKLDIAKKLGQKVAEVAKEKKIKAVIFDKGRYAYHGRVKALADGAREGGLTF